MVHLLVYSAPSLQVEHCLGFAGEHLTEYMYVYIDICKNKTKQTNKQKLHVIKEERTEDLDEEKMEQSVYFLM